MCGKATLDGDPEAMFQAGSYFMECSSPAGRRLAETKDVATTFVCSKHPETGQWCIPDEFKDALVVIDEVHEFYAAQRNQLPEEVENFFALIGQNGGDVLIMTQWINRVH